MFSRISRADADPNRGAGVSVTRLRVVLSGNPRRGLMVLFYAVLFVLFIACSNVANLLLARGAERGREIALRTALGAGRSRLWRQLLTEGAILAVLSGSAGLLLAISGIRLLIHRFDGHVDLR
jgi:putative ABC transport system permease protein